MISEYEIIYFPVGTEHAPHNPFHVLSDQLRLFRKLSLYRPDLVHINPSLTYRSFFRDAAFSLIIKRSGSLLTVFFRGWDDGVADTIGTYMLPILKKTFGKADQFIVLANKVEEQLRNWGLKAPIVKTTTVVSDADVKDFALDTKLSALRTDAKLKILFLARLEKTKGIFETVDAVRKLAAEGHSISLTVAGSGQARQELADNLTSPQLEPEQVRMVGFVSGREKAALLAEHHVYCLPTYHGEGIPNSLLEAMAFGMPVITCSVGGIPDFFEHGKMGFLVQERSSTAIKSRLLQLIEDRRLCADIAAYNSAYAKRHFFASTVAEQLFGAYRAILSEKS